MRIKYKVTASTFFFIFIFFYREKKVFPGVNLIQPDASTEQYDEFLNRRH